MTAIDECRRRKFPISDFHFSIFNLGICARARLTLVASLVIGLTIARREPVIRLNKVDFPTFGRPTSTTEGLLADIRTHVTSDT